MKSSLTDIMSLSEIDSVIEKMTKLPENAFKNINLEEEKNKYRKNSEESNIK